MSSASIVAVPVSAAPVAIRPLIIEFRILLKSSAHGSLGAVAIGPTTATGADGVLLGAVDTQAESPVAVTTAHAINTRLNILARLPPWQSPTRVHHHNKKCVRRDLPLKCATTASFIQCSRAQPPGWTPLPSLATIRGMGRYTFPAFNKAPTPRYVVVWDLQWALIEYQHLGPARGLIRRNGGDYRSTLVRAGKPKQRLSTAACSFATAPIGGC